MGEFAPRTREYDAARRQPARDALASMAGDIGRAHPLAVELARRDLKAQYRSAALGMAWALIIPAFTIAIWLFIRASGAIEVRSAGTSYPTFLVTGVLLWAIFVDAALAPLQQVSGSGGMLTKIDFPREALLLSGVYQVLFSATIKLAVLVVALWLLGVPPARSMALLPLAALALVAIGTVCGILVAPVGGLFSDVGRALPLVLHSLMFLAPVVYDTPRAGWAAQLIAANPLTPLVTFGRSAALGGPLQQAQEAVVVCGVSLAVLLVAWWVFRAAMPVVVERLGG